jgi:hypothetical protein
MTTASNPAGTLTLGQERVRAIVANLVPAFQHTTTDEQADGLYDHLAHTLATDALLQQDDITGQRLGYHKFARSYLTWLSKSINSQYYDLKTNFPPVRLDNFVYSYSADEEAEEELLACSGGNAKKRRHTMYFLFCLATQKPFSSYQMEAAYWERSGILSYISGGNHRLLAHVLWGQPLLRPQFMRIFQENERACDDELNPALIVVDRIYLPSGGFTFENYSSAEELAAVKNIGKHFLTSPDEFNIIKEYVHQEQESRLKESRLRLVWGLQDCLDELKGLKRPRFFRLFQNSFSRNPPTSADARASARIRKDFAEWYKRLRDQ